MEATRPSLRFAATKIQPPRLRSVRIARERLQPALRAALVERRVVLLLAPAGFGKTCALAAQFDGSDGLPPPGALAWVSLDEDDDPARWFACLAAALEPLDPPWRSAPDALVAAIGGGDEAARRVVDELVNTLAATEVAHGVIVFDDLHRVQHAGVHALLERLVERLPPAWTVVLSTRVEPPMALARWRVADELAAFTQADLRFDASESRALAGGMVGGTAGADEWHERTQGWPAGLRLCLAAAQSRPGGGTARTARVDHHVFDYLAGEVLDEMPAELHDFLLRCAVLPVLTSGRCAAVSGDARAAERLDEIERRGLFVTVLDAAERTLVLHDLFREALDERLRRRLPGELPALLRRAAAGETDPLRKLGYLLRAGDHAAAEAALREAGEELFLVGGAGEVRRAIEQFPPEFRAGSSTLQLLQAACQSQTWEFDAMVVSAQAALAAARAEGNAAAVDLAQGYLASALHNVGRHTECLALLESLRDQPLDGRARIFVLTSECSMLFRRGLHDQLAPAFEALLGLLEKGATLFTWWSCGPSSSWMSVPGMRPLIERYCRGALLRVGERDLPMRADLRMLQAWALLWSGQVDAALAEAEEAARDSRWLVASAGMEGNLLVFRALVDAWRGNRAGVDRMLSGWLARTPERDPASAMAWRNDLAGFAIRVHAALGSDAQTLVHWAALLKNSVPDVAGFPGTAIATSCFSARHAEAQGRWGDAAALYAAVLPIAATMDSLGQANELHARAAHAALRAGLGVDAAAPMLAGALARVGLHGEQGHLLMAGAEVLSALAAAPWGERLDAAALGVLRETAELAQRLRASAAGASGAHAGAGTRAADAGAGVGRGGGGGAGGEGSGRAALRAGGASAPEESGATGTPEVLSQREREVLERIAAGDSNKVIARVLDISPHTVKRHVGNILDKLALGSRGQAAAWLRAHPR